MVLLFQNGQWSPLASLLPMILIFAIFYFLIIMPQRKRQKQLQDMIASLKIGDKIITTGGIYGTVAGLKDDTLILRIAEHVKIEVARSAVAALQQPREEKKGNEKAVKSEG